MNDEIMSEERGHLKSVLKKIKNAKEEISNSLETLGKETMERLKELKEEGSSSYGYGTNDFDILLEQLHQKNQAFNIKGKYQTLSELEFLLSEPYFSRIDLFNPDDKKTGSYYIGKFSYTERKPVVTDWRSKVASVYYRYRYPQKAVSYDTPMGIEVRDLELKRTFEIQDGELVKYYNNDLQLDENSIISDKIGKRTGGVLEDIIQTIQVSQLDIIEADPRQVCVVQGCVGSGKSTVAIHKLAHIFFNFPKLIHPERSLMITKSQILAGYLSTLFPKLGIFDITYKTVRDVVYNLIFREELKIKFDLGKDEDTSYYTLSRVAKLKKSILSIQKSCEKKILAIFNNPDLESFASFKYSYDETPYENIQGLLEDVAEEISIQKERLKLDPDGVNAWLHKENISNLRKILKEGSKVKHDITNKVLQSTVKKFGIELSKELNYSVTLLYVYIYSQLVGMKNTRKYEYCVVDEAQDFSLLEYLVLDKVVMRGRFALFGDLNQSLEIDGVKSWDEIPEVIEDAKTAVKFKLEENYRSTKQIIDFANKILSPYTKKYLPKSINRIGSEPEVELFHDTVTLKIKFMDRLKEDLSRLDKSIGIIVYESENMKYKEIEDVLSKLELKAGVITLLI